MTDFWRSFFGSLLLFGLWFGVAVFLNGCQTTSDAPVDLGPPPEAIARDEALILPEREEKEDVEATPFEPGEITTRPFGCERMEPRQC